jgi:hypothetical protein
MHRQVPGRGGDGRLSARLLRPGGTLPLGPRLAWVMGGGTSLYVVELCPSAPAAAASSSSSAAGREAVDGRMVLRGVAQQNRRRRSRALRATQGRMCFERIVEWKSDGGALKRVGRRAGSPEPKPGLEQAPGTTSGGSYPHLHNPFDPFSQAAGVGASREGGAPSAGACKPPTPWRPPRPRACCKAPRWSSLRLAQVSAPLHRCVAARGAPTHTLTGQLPSGAPRGGRARPDRSDGCAVPGWALSFAQESARTCCRSRAASSCAERVVCPGMRESRTPPLGFPLRASSAAHAARVRDATGPTRKLSVQSARQQRRPRVPTAPPCPAPPPTPPVPPATPASPPRRFASGAFTTEAFPAGRLGLHGQ